MAWKVFYYYNKIINKNKILKYNFLQLLKLKFYYNAYKVYKKNFLYKNKTIK